MKLPEAVRAARNWADKSLVVDEAGIVEPPVNTTIIQNLPTIYSVVC